MSHQSIIGFFALFIVITYGNTASIPTILTLELPEAPVYGIKYPIFVPIEAQLSSKPDTRRVQPQQHHPQIPPTNAHQVHNNSQQVNPPAPPQHNYQPQQSPLMQSPSMTVHRYTRPFGQPSTLHDFILRSA